MDKITPCLWFDIGKAEEAADFYTSLFPDSRIVEVQRSAADTPSGPEGMVITVEFELFGKSYIGLNGGPEFKFNEAISLQIECEDQAEIDRYWDALIADGGESGPCGWLKDRFGLSWQVTPKRLLEMYRTGTADQARRAMEQMLRMSKLDIEPLERAFAGEPIGEEIGSTTR
ncbi:MAG TPA: VOC family protein [Candidatus Limnocylindrales bacterium]|nr:VOC family protein [Candidatus Limnocylindrales bacterium]